MYCRFSFRNTGFVFYKLSSFKTADDSVVCQDLASCAVSRKTSDEVGISGGFVAQNTNETIHDGKLNQGVELPKGYPAGVLIKITRLYDVL